MKFEKRNLTEFRSIENTFNVEGYATTFDKPYVLYEYDGVKHYEVVDRHALDDADISDVILQYDHTGKILARTSNNTLNLKIDDHGLKINADLSKTNASKDLYDEIQTGLINKMSWAFCIEKSEYNEGTRTSTILKVSKVFDVSAVSYPANSDTEINSRNKILLNNNTNKQGGKNMKLREIRAKIKEFQNRLQSEEANDLTEEEITKTKDDLAELFAKEAELQSQLDKLKSEINELSEVDSSDFSENKRGKVLSMATFATEPKVNERHSNKYETLEYRNAFKDYVLRGKSLPIQYRADALTTTTDVGTIIPQNVLDKIVEKLESTGMILPLITRTNYKGGLTIPSSSVKPVATWVAEGSSSDKQNITVAGTLTFNYFKLRCAVAMSLEVESMSLSVFEATMINNITEAMVKALETAIINGSGSGQPTGILTVSVDSDKKIVIDGNQITYNNLIKAEGALPIAYEGEAVWVMTKKTFMGIASIEDNNGLPIGITNYGGLAGKPERILLGRQVILCDYLPSLSDTTAPNTVVAFLYSFKDYILNTNYELGIKKYEDNNTDDIVTKALMLVDGKPADSNSLVLISTSAQSGA